MICKKSYCSNEVMSADESDVSNMQNDVGWLVHLPFELLKILKCFSCPWSNLFVQQTLKIQPWCGLLCWVKLLKVGRLAAQMGLAIGFAYVRIQFQLQEIDKQIVTKWNHLSHKVSNMNFVSLCHKPPATSLVQNFWRRPCETQMQTLQWLAWPTWTFPCGRRALQSMFDHQGLCTAVLPAEKDKPNRPKRVASERSQIFDHNFLWAPSLRPEIVAPQHQSKPSKTCHVFSCHDITHVAERPLEVPTTRCRTGTN